MSLRFGVFAGEMQQRDNGEKNMQVFFISLIPRSESSWNTMYNNNILFGIPNRFVWVHEIFAS